MQTGFAQTVRGRVIEADTGQPLPGVFVMLLDAGGAPRGAVLTDSLGRYTIQVASEIAVAVRAEFIGRRSYQSKYFSGTAGALADIALPVEAIILDAIEASATQRCVARPESAEQTMRLWQEAAKALKVTAWGHDQQVVRTFASTYDRILDPHTFAVLKEVVERRIGSARTYAAVSADTLAATGFMRVVRGDSLAFFGPDAEVLLSDAFLDTHCFIAVSGRGKTAGLAGLSFKPIPRRKVVDIAGTLWIDPQTAELRYIEFRYVGLPRVLSVGEAVGRTDFRRLPNGLWIVDRWYIRTPLVAAQLNDDFTIAAIGETGGQVTETTADSANRNVRIYGSVHDSVRAEPLANAQVYLSGTPYSTRADSLGNFIFEAVPPGSYAISFWHPTVDSLPYFPPSRSVELRHTRAITVDLAVPSIETVIGRACPAHPADGVVSGYVLAAERPVAGETVSATYASRSGVVQLRSTSDRAGRYLICGIPIDRNLRITTGRNAVELRRINDVRFIRVDLPATGNTVK